MNETDFTLAIHVDDISMLECIFHTEPPTQETQPSVRLMVTNPKNQFSLDRQTRRTVLHGSVNIQFGLSDATPNPSAPNDVREFVHFGLIAGVTASVPAIKEAAGTARHMAGKPQDANAHRDKNMEHALRLEAIKAAYALASSKFSEMSAMSPLGKMTLPLIDADELLYDMQKDDAESASQ